MCNNQDEEPCTWIVGRKHSSLDRQELYCKLTCRSKLTSDLDMTLCKDAIKEVFSDREQLAKVPCLYKVAQAQQQVFGIKQPCIFLTHVVLSSLLPDCQSQRKATVLQLPAYTIRRRLSFLSANKEAYSIVVAQYRLEVQYQ